MQDARRFAVREAGGDDAPTLAALLADAFAGSDACWPEASPPDAAGLALRLQTGEAFLLAERGERPAGCVRRREPEEGIGGFDLLASGRAGAGRALVRAVEARAQDGGLRLVRARIPDEPRLAGYFAALGYLPVGRERAGALDVLTVERRLPLLTVRGQRRGDAEAIAALTGEDPWPFTQGPRPGWFVAADGERVAGAIHARVGRDGRAAIGEPALAPGYEGRGLDAWMVERAAHDAGTRGAHTAELPLTDGTRQLRARLEERGWDVDREGGRYTRRLGDLLDDAFAE